MGWFLNQLLVGCGEFYGQNDTHLRVGWRARWDGEEQESVGLPLERGVVVDQAVSAATTPAGTTIALKVFLKTLTATTTPAALLIVKKVAEFLYATADTVATISPRTISKRITRTVSVALQRSRTIAKRIKAKSGPKGTGTGDFPIFVERTINQNASSSATRTVAWPTNIQANDIAILAVMNSATPGPIAYPYVNDPAGGWTDLGLFAVPSGVDAYARAWWKRLDGTETGNQSIVLSTGPGALALVNTSISIWRGCIEDEIPVEGWAAQRAESATQGHPAISTLGPNRLLVAMICNLIDNIAGTPNGSAVEQWDNTSNDGNGGAHACYTLECADAGSHSLTRASNNLWYESIAFALIPQPPGGGEVGQINEAVATASLEMTHPRNLNRTAGVSAAIVRLTSKIIGQTADAVASLDALFDGGAIDQVVDATAEATASIRRTTAKLLNRTADAAATLAKQISKPVTATADTEAAIVRSTLKRITRSAAASASIVMQTAKVLLAQSATVATIRRLTFKSISASTEPQALLTPVRTFIRSMTATGNASALIRRATTRTITATAQGIASLQRVASLFRTLSASAPGSATIRRTTHKSLTALADASASIRRTIAKQLLAVANAAATLAEVFRGYVPSLRRIIPAREPSRRAIAPRDPSRTQIAAGENRRAVPSVDPNRAAVAGRDPQRVIIPGTDEPRNIDPNEEDRTLEPPPDDQ